MPSSRTNQLSSPVTVPSAKAGGSILRPVIVVAIFSVLFGLSFGSFLNVCISRLPKHQSIVHPPSRCPECGESIWIRDNLPLVGWILLGGHCRHCNSRIPLRYPLVELAAAALFLLTYLTFNLTLEGAGMVVLCFLLLGLAVMDAESLFLSNAFTVPGIALGIVYSAIRGGWRAAVLAVVSAVAAAGLILLIRSAYWLVRKQEGMGLGDAKLMAMIAAWLGPWQTLLAFFLAMVAAAIFGLFWISLKKGGSMRTLQLPFGSFLCAAAIYAVFQGQPILKWYLQFFR
ncbi:prepilin peptidase [Alloacidobacterium dinghuense]|uniref:Prepilin leader peptidase/N-methyltransferase n=1 Tax=Alloacidobacterium dinghuense TaxID=2763107 RepID=A0A7G8BCG4_9BACT|nr:A24 family peptidase [Alloacidobacterium dinghuense]QNI30234.1 prepilin peptidase [Alloacidobacterium dinghuense]